MQLIVHHKLGCFQWFKDTNLKANHNDKLMLTYGICCFQWFKDTNLKANHNHAHVRERPTPVVSNGSKILI